MPVPGEDPVRRGLLDDYLREIEGCQRCPLGATRTCFVFGTGRSNPRLMFIGEAPGEEEDLTGEPFVGRAGQLLTRMIAAMGLRRSDVYIGNILKCRPPDNRAPSPFEMGMCRGYILRQIEILRPEIICALGAVALRGLLDNQRLSIGSMRGRFMEWQGAKLIATYHPSYLLRSPGDKPKVWEDLQKILNELGLPMPQRGRRTPD